MNNRAHNDDDDALLDRLVDGELSGDEQRELLASLEQQPDGWRRCALAFLESQAWRKEMRGLVAPVSRDNVALAALSTEAPKDSRRSSPRFSSSWLTAAAALLLAFGLGHQLGAYDRADPLDAELAQQSQSPTSTTDAPQFDRSGDAVTLVVNDQRGVPQRVRVPLIEARQLGVEFAEAPQWSSSPELVQRLREQGLGLAARRRYLPIQFEEQNQTIPMIVPVDDAVVTPVSRPVY